LLDNYRMNVGISKITTPIYIRKLIPGRWQEDFFSSVILVLGFSG
jgi:hypothetical protein